MPRFSEAWIACWAVSTRRGSVKHLVTAPTVNLLDSRPPAFERALSREAVCGAVPEDRSVDGDIIWNSLGDRWHPADGALSRHDLPECAACLAIAGREPRPGWRWRLG